MSKRGKGFVVGRRSMLKAAATAAVAATMPIARNAQAQTSDPVKIGVIIPLTGAAAVAGNDSFSALKIARDEINRAGGVLGRPIELIVEDDEGRPKSGVEAANKLADVDNVAACIGAYQSIIAVPVGQLLNEKGVVWVTDASTNELKKIGPYVFNVAGIAEQAVALVDFVKQDRPETKTLTGIFQNSPIGQDRYNVSEQRTKDLGLEWLSAPLFPSGVTDFRAELQEVIGLGADAIVTDVFESDLAIIQRQLVEMGVVDFSNHYSYNPGAYATLQPALTQGVKGLNYVANGTRASPFTKTFEEQTGHIYTDAWGGPPFYDALWIVATAINLVNGLDRRKIRDAMWPAAYHYLGVSGHGDKGFNKWGMQASDQYAKLVFKEGKLVAMSDGPDNFVTFRYVDDQGEPLQFAPSEDQLKELYPSYNP